MLVISGRRWLFVRRRSFACVRACLVRSIGVWACQMRAWHSGRLHCCIQASIFSVGSKLSKGPLFAFAFQEIVFFSETVLTLWFYFIFCNEHFCSRNIDEVHLWYRCNKVCPSLLSFLQTPKIIFKFQQLLKVIKCYQDNLHSLKHLNSPKYHLQFVLR